MVETKRTSKLVILAVLVVVILLFLIFGFVFVRNMLSVPNDPTNQRTAPINQDRIATCNEHLEITFSPIEGEETGGGILPMIVAIIRDNLGDGNYVTMLQDDFDVPIYLTSLQDIITIQLSNPTDDPMNLMLKVFLNYEETKFYVLGQETPDTEVLFTLASGYYANIPIALSKQSEIHDGVGKLSIGVFMAPEYYIMYDDHCLRRFYGRVLTYDIIIDPSAVLILPYDDYFEPTGECTFGGFSIHPNPSPPGNGSIWTMSEPLVVNRGELIELSFFANATLLEGESTDNYLIMAMLDWHQVLINDRPYLLVDTRNTCPSLGKYGQFVIVAPDEPGFYEFSAFLVPNPRSPNSVWNFDTVEISSRFTIEVVD